MSLSNMMRLSKCLMKNFIAMPINIGHKFEECSFLWERKISAKEKDFMIRQSIDQDLINFRHRDYWFKVGEQIAYCPTDDDFAHHLKVTVIPKSGPTLMAISPYPVEIGPSECPFEKRHNHAAPASSHFRFMSYNILADIYADSDYSRKVLFKHCPTYALSIDYRRQLFLKEIPGYNATIICLQEVDQKEFSRTFELYLKVYCHYEGVFAKKGGQVPEGLATFYQRDKFDLIEHQRTLLPSLLMDQPVPDDNHPILNALKPEELKDWSSKLGGIREFIASSETLKKRFMARNTVLQTNLLRSKIDPGNFLLVANTHLYFAPDADHVRLLQGSICMKYLEYLKDYYTRSLLNNCETPGAKISVIFCGDMNSQPHNGFHELMTTSQVEASHPDWSKGGDEVAAGLKVTSNLRFSSAYQDIPYTHYVPEFNGCLDYIYYEKDSLHCDSVVPLPDHEDVIASDGLPNNVFPSDHIALVADMSLTR